MTQQEYEQKRAECWEQFLRLGGTEGGRLTAEAFILAFDRAFALGKQEKDADTVIQGWVARDKDGDVPLFVGEGKPYRNKYGEFIGCPTLYLPRNEFPDILSYRDPIEVELIIKRKKNGNNSTDNRI